MKARVMDVLRFLGILKEKNEEGGKSFCNIYEVNNKKWRRIRWKSKQVRI